jgi:hypothetical protein
MNSQVMAWGKAIGKETVTCKVSPSNLIIKLSFVPSSELVENNN